MGRGGFVGCECVSIGCAFFEGALFAGWFKGEPSRLFVFGRGLKGRQVCK